jgi:hypothetical protein
VLAGPQRRVAAGGGNVAGADEPGADPGKRRLGPEPDRGAAGLGPGQVAQHGADDVPSVQGGDVGGVDRVEQVADREDAVGGGAQPGVHDGAQVLGVDLETAQAGQFVIGNPVPGEDHGVAGEGPPLPVIEVLELDRADPVPADHAGDPGAPGDRHAQAQPPRGGHRGVGLRPTVLGGHQRGPAARGPQGQHGGPADQFRAHDDRAGAGRLVVQVDVVLQLAGGEDAVRAVAGNQARGPRPFAGTGGEHHRAGIDPARPPRAGHQQRAIGGPRGDHGRQADLGADGLGQFGQAPGVGRTGQQGPQVTYPVPQVVAVPGDAADLGLPLEDEHRGHAGGAQVPGGGQPGGPAADDDHLGALRGQAVHRGP